ncbi:hypothetical protein JOB18_018592, partial [Solea senegalensis]
VISKRCQIVASGFTRTLSRRERAGGVERPPLLLLFPRCLRRCCSLCSRRNIGSFRRRRYEMAETARVTEAQRVGYAGATHISTLVELTGEGLREEESSTWMP